MRPFFSEVRWYQAAFTVPFATTLPPRFLRPRRKKLKPVNGGRWYIRLDPIAWNKGKEKVWYAYQIPNRRRNRRFTSFENAWAYVLRQIRNRELGQ